MRLKGKNAYVVDWHFYGDEFIRGHLGGLEKYFFYWFGKYKANDLHINMFFNFVLRDEKIVYMWCHVCDS